MELHPLIALISLTESQTDVLTSFMSILLEGAPFIFLGTLISGFIDAWLPARTIDRFLPKNRTAAIFLSGLLGAILPVCECVVVPVMRRLIKKGLPVSCAVTYMLSAPIVNPITAFSTWKAYQSIEPTNGISGGLYMAGSRIILAYIVTVTIGLIIQRISNRKVLSRRLLKSVEIQSIHSDHGHEHGHSHDHGSDDEKVATSVRIIRAMRAARRDFLDTAMYFSIGALITAAFSTQFEQATLKEYAGNNYTSAAILMGFAFILSVCSTSDAFLSFQLSSVFAFPAQMAFMVFGPMMDVKLIFMYTAVFRKRFIIWLGIGLFLAIGILSVAWPYPEL